MTKAGIYIVTPCRNAAKTINETIASVVSQTGDFISYYHVQDGASTDGTVAILKQWQQKLKGGPGNVIFSWRSAPDKGMYDAIDKALKIIRPPANAFTGWINADDIFYPDAFRFLAEITPMGGVEWVTGYPLMVDEKRRVLRHNRHKLYSRETLRRGFHDGRYIPFVQQEGTFFRKRLWDAAGGIDETTRNMRGSGDWVLWRRFAEHTELTHAPLQLASFCRRKGQSTENMADYYAEIDPLFSIEERRKQAGQLLIRPWRLCRGQYLEQKSGHWRLRRGWLGYALYLYTLLTYYPWLHDLLMRVKESGPLLREKTRI